MWMSRKKSRRRGKIRMVLQGRRREIRRRAWKAENWPGIGRRGLVSQVVDATSRIFIRRRRGRAEMRRQSLRALNVRQRKFKLQRGSSGEIFVRCARGGEFTSQCERKERSWHWARYRARRRGRRKCKSLRARKNLHQYAAGENPRHIEREKRDRGFGPGIERVGEGGGTGSHCARKNLYQYAAEEVLPSMER